MALTQLVEYHTFNVRVMGSSHISHTIRVQDLRMHRPKISIAKIQAVRSSFLQRSNGYGNHSLVWTVVSKVEKWVRPCKAYMQRKMLSWFVEFIYPELSRQSANTSLSRTIHESWTCHLDSIGLGMKIARCHDKGIMRDISSIGQSSRLITGWL